MLILDKFPQLSAEWLLRGEGEMFRKGDALQMSETGGTAQGTGAMNHSNSDVTIHKFLDEIAAQRHITQSIIEQNKMLLQMLSNAPNIGAN